MNPNLRAYQKNQALMASPVEQVALLLDRAARLMDDAHKAMLDNRFEDRFLHSEKAIKIITGLASVLKTEDPTMPTEVRALILVMEGFYREMLIKIMDMSLKNDPRICLEIVEKFREMGGEWHDANKRIDPPAAPPPAP
jgi:flagellar biosynthetic protein FliS